MNGNDDAFVNPVKPRMKGKHKFMNGGQEYLRKLYSVPSFEHIQKFLSQPELVQLVCSDRPEANSFSQS